MIQESFPSGSASVHIHTNPLDMDGARSDSGVGESVSDIYNLLDEKSSSNTSVILDGNALGACVAERLSSRQLQEIPLGALGEG